MYIKELNIKKFGCIKDKIITLTEGFNLICGENEAGKTTVMSFILFMFYGLKHKNTGNQLALKKKYTPWDSDSIEGYLTFIHNSYEYVLCRKVYSAKNEISLFCVTTGCEIKDKNILDSPGEYYFGISSEGFIKTIYLTSMTSKISTDKSDEIITKLRTLYETGSFEVSYKEIIDKLNLEISLLVSEKRKKALIIDTENKILMLEEKIRECKSMQQNIDDAKSRISERYNEIQYFENTLSEYKEKINLISQEDKRTHMFSSIGCSVGVLLIAISVILYIMHIVPAGLAALLPAVFGVFILIGIYFVHIGTEKAEKRKLFTSKEFNDKIVSINNDIYNLKIDNYKDEQILRKPPADLPSLEKELGDLKKQREEYKIRLEALTLAVKATEYGYKQLQTCFSPELSKKASYILSRLTNGKYSSILIDDSFYVNVSTTNGYNSALYVSRATYEQIYLSMRLAIAEMVFSPESVPVFLDDVFAFYDSGRCLNGFKYLMEFSKGRQVLFAACKYEELSALSDSEQINIIYLK